MRMMRKVKVIGVGISYQKLIKIILILIFLLTSRKTKIFISYEVPHPSGVDMDLVTAIEYLQALLVLAIFILILATGFKVWRWNYVVPPR